MEYEYDYNEFPLAYLITLRTYGTWLHGDERLSVDRKFNKHGTPRRAANPKLQKIMLEETKQKPFLLNDNQRETVDNTIKEVCKNRGYHLQAVNVGSNHLHAVVSAQVKPELIINAFKSYATRRLREKFMIEKDTKVWARGKSRRYLWKPRSVALAIEYVLYGQGDIIADMFDLPEFDD